MHMLISFIFTIILMISSMNLSAENNKDYKLFEKIFSDWTIAFNQKDLAKTCQLFAKSVQADYQGVPKKNYQTICRGFKKIFNLPNQRYQYQFKLHDVYRSQNLAGVRITWYLRFYENNRLKSITQDEGIDIFQRNQSGRWEIVNYLAYPIH